MEEREFSTEWTRGLMKGWRFFPAPQSIPLAILILLVVALEECRGQLPERGMPRPLPAVYLDERGYAGQAAAASPDTAVPQVASSGFSVLHQAQTASQVRLGEPVAVAISVRSPAIQSHDSRSKLSQSLTVVQLWREAARVQQEAQQLLERRAYYAARRGAIDALGFYAAASDLGGGYGQAQSDFAAALRAIREAGDFVGRYGVVDSEAQRRMIRSHSTPVLENGIASDCSPHEAADEYLDFARDRFGRAFRSCAAAAGALRLLGLAETRCEENPHAIREGIALCALRAALLVDPTNVNVHHDLGSYALQAGLDAEAEWVLKWSFEKQPTPGAIQGLIALYERRGQADAARSLEREYSQLLARGYEKHVYQLPPETFASISPPVQVGNAVAWPAGMAFAQGAGPAVRAPNASMPAMMPANGLTPSDPAKPGFGARVSAVMRQVFD